MFLKFMQHFAAYRGFAHPLFYLFLQATPWGRQGSSYQRRYANEEVPLEQERFTGLAAPLVGAS